MIRHLLLFLMLLTVPLLQAEAASLPALDILTEDDPPLTFSQNGQPAGLVVEVVREIQRRVGSRDAITVLPWARGYRLAQIQANVALFNTNRIGEREHLFKWVGPVTTTLGSFFVRRDSKLKLSSLNDARKLGQILVVRDWYLQLMLSGQGFSNLSAIATPNQMVSMLMHGRAEVIASENTTMPTQLKQLGYQLSDVHKAYTFIYTSGYIAFSLQTPDTVIRAWQQALDDMKRDGTFAAIYHRWLPGEPMPGMSGAPNEKMK